MSERLILPHNPNSKASRKYQQRHHTSDDGKSTETKRKSRRNRKKNKNELPVSREEAEAPKSFIITRGRVTKYCKFLRDDLRLIFSPYTAAKLREKQSNSLKDFIVSSQEFGVTHLMTLSQSDIAGTMLRMIRLPKGPTFWFQIKGYSLIQDIIKMQQRSTGRINFKKWNTMKHNKTSSFLPHHIQFALRFAPLVILNGFSIKSSVSANNGTEQQLNTANNINRCSNYHKQLMSVMFKHMFCPLNVIGMKLTHCKRVVFINYDSENDVVQVRHYKIQIASNLKGISKGIKKIIKQKKDRYKKYGDDMDKYPDLSKYEDIKDFVLDNKGDIESESEVDDDENTKVIMDKLKSVNANNSCFVRLKEIGPRVDMQLVKIEELINDGKVLYHRYITKTKQEIEELQKKKDDERELRQQRVVRQQLNVKKKEDIKKERDNQRIEIRKKREVEQLLQSFEVSEDNKKDEKGKGKKREIEGILKNTNDGPNRKKRKLNKTNKTKRRVRF